MFIILMIYLYNLYIKYIEMTVTGCRTYVQSLMASKAKRSLGSTAMGFTKPC